MQKPLQRDTATKTIIIVEIMIIRIIDFTLSVAEDELSISETIK